MGLLVSHLMREAIKRNHYLLRPVNQQIPILLGLTLFFAVLLAMAATLFENAYRLRLSKGEPLPFSLVYISNLWGAFVVLFIWNGIYFMWHYIAKARRHQLDNLQLEGLVKELELKTIKAHINPHFIFNALNSIRALIDENPDRARTAITELSNILRSSLKADKGETVAFADELQIVKDYLALENMRFEDRLQVEYQIDAESLQQTVPPMMLQTLVENAIKHGISKQVNGGVVRIKSQVVGGRHVLSIQNTGYLNGYRSKDGFGLASTQDRLHLLYGSKAQFRITQVQEGLVEATVSIPLSLN